MAKPSLPSLEQVDPVTAWQPWEPDAKSPWSIKWAGHLLRRAGFGASLPELKQAVKDGLATTLDKLFRDDAAARERTEFLETNGKRVAQANNAYQLRGWWIYTMLNTLQPAREKLTLFWHNHFATSIAKVQRGASMFNQNVLLRKYALGPFRPFLQDMSKDVAMIVWLDNNSNVKGKPNENYAREIMELFSLGVATPESRHYTEKDIREAARAFTGWHTDGEKFDFNKNFHDNDDKTVLGKTGNLNGDDVVNICVDQPACAKFLVRKLYKYLIAELDPPPQKLLDPLCEMYRKSEYDTGKLVRTMLTSRLFFSDHAYRQRVKSPCEFTLGAVKAVGQGFVTPQSLVTKMEGMGQSLFAPPNVKGWEGGMNWLNTATILARHNFAQMLCNESGRLNLNDPSASVGVHVDPSALIRREKITDPKEMVALLAELLLDGEMEQTHRERLMNFIAEGAPKDSELDQRVRDAIHAIMTMPEYQLS
jgi:uncharacterized protein (DUF1800 family)